MKSFLIALLGLPITIPILIGLGLCLAIAKAKGEYNGRETAASIAFDVGGMILCSILSLSVFGLLLWALLAWS